jgi:hypothetical protein
MNLSNNNSTLDNITNNCFGDLLVVCVCVCVCVCVVINYCIQTIITTSPYILLTLNTPAIFINLFVIYSSLHILHKTQESIHVFIFGMAIADLLFTGIIYYFIYFNNLQQLLTMSII